MNIVVISNDTSLGTADLLKSTDFYLKLEY